MSLPTLFVPHGAPTFALNPGAAGAALSHLGATLPRPRAIVMISAHWDTAVPTVGSAAELETIHDFWGFPEALYAMRYPARGDAAMAGEVAAAIAAAGLPVAVDPSRGLDHGAWVPLRLMYPAADLPVVPLSLQSAGGPEHAWRLGSALAPLIDAGYLIIGSGSITHNLRDYQLARAQGGRIPDYVPRFADWFAAQAESGNPASLLDYRAGSPDGARAHPSEEHLLPFFVALGAAGPAAQARRLHASIDDFVIAMDAYAFSPAAAG